MSLRSAVITQRPLRRFAAHATATCAVQASVYGKCIVARYTDMTKNACEGEFTRFQQCMQEAVRVCFFCFIHSTSLTRAEFRCLSTSNSNSFKSDPLRRQRNVYLG